MGQNCHGPILLWAEMVRDHNLHQIIYIITAPSSPIPFTLPLPLLRYNNDFVIYASPLIAILA